MTKQALFVYLLCHFWFGAQLKQTASKTRCCFEVTQFEEKIESCSQYQNHVDRLQTAVCEICCHLKHTHKKKKFLCTLIQS